MRNIYFFSAATLIVGYLSVAPLAAQTLTLGGLSGAERTLSAAEISTFTHISLTVKQHDKEHVFEGVPLATLLALVGAPLGQDLRGKELADVVLIKARDGYTVAIALADVDPAMQSRQVILADKMDGSTLASDHGPFQLVVEGDARPARAVRMVESIHLFRISAPERK